MPLTSNRLSANRRAMFELITRYEHGMETAIQMQTQLYNLRVVFEGTRAYTDGNTIVLPNVRVFATHDDITDEEVDEARAYFMALRGYAWREAARLVETDHVQLRKWRVEHGSFAFSLLTLLDDIRVEHRFGKQLPGIQEAIEYMRETWLWPRFVRRKLVQRPEDLDVMYEMMLGMQCALKHGEARIDHAVWKVLDASVRSFVERFDDDLNAAYDTFKMGPQEGTARLTEVVQRIIERWSAEYAAVEPLVNARSLAGIDSDAAPNAKVSVDERLLKLLQKQLREEKQKVLGKTEADSQMDDVAEMLTNAAKPPLLFVNVGPRLTTLASIEFDGSYVQCVEPVPTRGDAAAWEALTPPGYGEQRTVVLHPPDPKMERALDEMMGGLISNLMSASHEVQEKAKKAVEDAHEKIERLPEDQKPYLVYTTANDEFVKTPEGSPTEFAALRTQVMNSVGVVKNRLQVLLRSRTRTRWRSNRAEGNELDGDAMAQIALGAQMPNVEMRPFRTKVEADSLVDTVCSLLTDVSGSMAGRKLQLARWATLCFAEALDLAHMRFAVNAFTSNEDYWDSEYGKASEADRELYGRFGALHIEQCKTFDEPWRSVAQRLPRLGALNEANYDADSLQWAAKQLIAQKASRRVMFVLSDGQPATSEPPIQRARQQRHLKDVVKAVIAQGVEVVGIGICDSSVANYYPHHVVIHQASDLPKVIMNEMEFLLLRRRR